MATQAPPGHVTRRRAEPSSWRALIVVGLSTFLGGVLLGASFWPWDDQPPDEPGPPGATTADAGTESSVRHDGRSAKRRPSLLPVHLEIESIAVATPLVKLGLMPGRTVEVPSDADRAGWFRFGPKPGRRGSAVILGHVDSLEGPAVFARLQELRPGDVVKVDRADGSTVTFFVRRSVTYPNADFPAERVYGAQGARRLNLVTCGGTYDSTRGGYQANLVVYTRRTRGLGE